jgi:ribosomal protein S15P/S13E
MLESRDPRLASSLKEMNYCCGWFARMPKDIKDTAYKALSAYNLFYEIPVEQREIEEEDMNLLFTTIKYLANHTSIQNKHDFIKLYWLELEDRLVELGIKWQVNPKPN